MTVEQLSLCYEVRGNLQDEVHDLTRRIYCQTERRGSGAGKHVLPSPRNNWKRHSIALAPERS